LTDPLPDNPSEYCGGNDRINVYKLKSKKLAGDKPGVTKLNDSFGRG
jgi:hypothetical protein